MYLIGSKVKRKVFVLGRGWQTRHVLTRDSQLDTARKVEEDEAPSFVFGRASGQEANLDLAEKKMRRGKARSAVSGSSSAADDSMALVPVAAMLRKSNPNAMIAQLRGEGRHASSRGAVPASLQPNNNVGMGIYRS